MNGHDQKHETNGRAMQLRDVAVLISIALSVFTFAKSVFFAGGDIGSIQEHLRYNDQRLDTHERIFADAKAVDIRLTYIERNQQDEHESRKEQTKVIEEIKIELQKKAARK